MNENKKRMIKTGIAAALCAGAILYMLWKNGCFLPHWIIWENQRFTAGDGQYEVVLEDRQLTVRCGGEVRWASPDDMMVQTAAAEDIDGDGMQELVLVCWKQGRYGRHKPFWIKKDEKAWSQHLFVYAFTGEMIRPKWMSSYIGQDVCRMRTQTTGDGRVYLWLSEPDGHMNCWTWASWGFAKEETDVTFAVFGDTLIHEPIYTYGLRHNGDFSFLFENFQEVIGRSDVAIINQETPFTEDPARYGGYPRFGTPLTAGKAMVYAGFDVVTCATNHALDQGATGVNTTREFLEGNGVMCLGIRSQADAKEKPYEIIARNGIRFAMFNYTYGLNDGKETQGGNGMVHLLEDEDQVKRDLKMAGREADVVIVLVHWGTEGAGEPDAFQEHWAQVFLEGKVDVVIGTHPHTLQPCSVLRDDSGHEMLVFYSIGNFISAQTAKSCVRGGLATFTVSRRPEACSVTRYALQPLVITWHEGGKYQTDYAVFEKDYPLCCFSHVWQK